MKYTNDSLITTPQTMNWTSDGVYAGDFASLSYQLSLTTASASVKMQISNDLGSPNIADESRRDDRVTTWTDVAASVTAVSANGTLVYSIPDVTFAWFRLVVTGTGTVDSARFVARG